MNKKIIAISIAISIAIILIISGLIYILTLPKQTTLKIVTSFPMRGDEYGTDLLNGVKLALEEINYTIDGFRIELIAKDGGNSKGSSDPNQEEKNALQAVKDPKIIAYIGPSSSASAMLSIPITNEALLLHISPTNSYPGLTKEGYEENEPKKYYPTETKNYFRVMPTDDIQGEAAAIWAKELGFERIFIFSDGKAYGKGLANTFKEKGNEIGLNILGYENLDPDSKDYTEELEKIKDLNLDLIYFGGNINSGGEIIAKNMGISLPNTKLMAADTLKTQSFLDRIEIFPKEVYATSPFMAIDNLNEKGKDFQKKYEERFSKKLTEIYPILSYEATRVTIKAIQNSKEKNRNDILKAMEETKRYEGTFGEFNFDKNGDISLKIVSGNKIENEEWVFQKMIINN